MVTFTDIARLAVELGYTEHLTRQAVRKMADSDPEWPVPRDRWIKLGNAWALPWAPVKDYLAKRQWTGRGPAAPESAEAPDEAPRKPRADIPPTTEETTT